MQPLETKVHCEQWPASPLLKVAGLAEFAAGNLPPERMLLDLRDAQVRAAGSAICRLPWAGFLTDVPEYAPPDRPWIAVPQGAFKVDIGDVVELRPHTSKIALRYRRGSNNNILFTTERCNSYCLMCSQPPRKVDDGWRVSQLCNLVELIDRDEPSLTVTGGEPTLLGKDLRRIVAHCAEMLPHTHLHVLSNGRAFEDAALAQVFKGLHPSLTWGIPLYGDHYGLHDYIVQSAGAFSQTVRGLYALGAAKQHIEIRVVLVKPVVERLIELARFIYRNLPFVDHVALMGTEPIGFARGHHDDLWIDPVDMAPVLAKAVAFLSKRSMQVSLYNLPLCVLPEPLWVYSRRSISDWKQQYLPACEQCAIKERCGGFFAWMTDKWTSRAVKPVRGTSCAKH
jgi:His-Xaa-Ser system radical SAM maturase HxsC